MAIQRDPRAPRLMRALSHPVGALLALSAVLAVTWWLSPDERQPVVASPPPAAARALPPAAAGVRLPDPEAAVSGRVVAAAAASAPAAAASGARSARGIFVSDAAGRLLVDERMRLAVEALVVLNPPEALPGLLDAELAGLPPAAAAAARELALRYDSYQAAQRTGFPPGTAPLVPQEGLAELEGLVALRTSYFGADAARRMFGAEEAISRRLLQLMAEDRSTLLSMEQKAMRAQQRYDLERSAASAPR